MDLQLKNSLTPRWFIQSTLGVLLIVLLGVHLVINHWVAPNGLLNYADIIRYYDVPGIAWMEATLLIAVTVHCLMGLHAILLDMTLSSTVKKILTRLLVSLGFVIIVYGIWLTRKVMIL